MTTTSIDQQITAAQAEIETLLAQGQLDHANRKTCNLAADLAECWPGDERPRETRHLELGRTLAERCLSWRRELKPGPRSFAIAHRVHGMHMLSLARRQGGDHATLGSAIAAFERSVTAAIARAAEIGAVDRVAAEGDYLVVLNSGFLGVAREVAVPGSGRAMLERACESFRQQAARYPDRAEDARFGLENLRAAADRFLGARAVS